MNSPAPNTARTARPRKPLIFLVDDQPLLLDLAANALRGGNYRLRKFDSPQAARAAFHKARPKPDLIISDFAMGTMNGIELIEECKRKHPSLKCILVSGTAGAEIVLQSTVPVEHFVGKPYRPESLAQLVRLVLGDAPAA